MYNWGVWQETFTRGEEWDREGRDQQEREETGKKPKRLFYEKRKEERKDGKGETEREDGGREEKMGMVRLKGKMEGGKRVAERLRLRIIIAEENLSWVEKIGEFLSPAED